MAMGQTDGWTGRWIAASLIAPYTFCGGGIKVLEQSPESPSDKSQ